MAVEGTWHAVWQQCHAEVFLDLEARFSGKDLVFFQWQRRRAQLELEAKPTAFECDSHRNSLRKR
jgi:hypothetical protein